jgi:uncharacterized phage protein (TIGR01671 family)
MSREIKFRAWHKTAMVMGHMNEDGEFEFAYEDGEWLRISFLYNANDAIQSKVISVMQYTGLKDSAGIEIYEGDIVRLAGYGEYQAEFPFMDLYEASFHNDIGRIVGNIHEPELLGASDE